jgi:ankyrin repeat protein
MNESAATGLGLDSIDRLGPTELVNLVTYMISNNLPGEANSQDVYHRLKAGGVLDLLPSLASIDNLTTKALLEGVFRLAMKDLDTPIIKKLLIMNVNPNGHQIVLNGLFSTLDALQYACIRGEIELAQALLEAGATVKEDKRGWKRSILTIAIIGNYAELYGFYADVDKRVLNDSRNDKMGDDGENDVSTYRYDNLNNEHDEEFEGKDCYCDDHSIQRNDIRFMKLAESLMSAGAKVVFRVDDEDEGAWDEYFDNTPDAFQGCDSPLTAAANYKRQHLLDRLLSLGADANLMQEHGDSPLQQYLFSFEEASAGHASVHRDAMWTLPDLQAWMLARAEFKTLGCKNITGVAHSLLQANANPDQLYNSPDNQDFDLDDEYEAFLDATPLNMAILGGFEDLVESFLSSGAKPNQSCLEYTIRGGNRAILEMILDTDALLSYRSIRAAAELSQYDFFALFIAKRTTPLSRTRAVVEAVRSDIAEDLLDFQNFDPGLLKDHLSVLHEAVNHCCSTSTARASLFSKLFTSQCALSVLLLPTTPSVLDAIAHAGSMELWESLTRVVENLFRSPTAWVDTIVLPVPPKLAIPRYTSQLPYQKPVGSPPTLLQMAVEKGNVTQVKHLLEQQADPNFVPPGSVNPTFNHTPLQIAAMNGSKEITRSLLEYGANVNAPHAQILEPLLCNSRP